MIYHTKYILDTCNFFDCDYCTINDDETKIHIDYQTKLIKFIINSDIKKLNITFYKIGVFATSNKIIINIDDSYNYNYKFNIQLDKSLKVYDYYY
jgi:hypothetical protein